MTDINEIAEMVRAQDAAREQVRKQKQLQRHGEIQQQIFNNALTMYVMQLQAMGVAAISQPDRFFVKEPPCSK